MTIRLINLNESPYITETSRTKDGNTTKIPPSLALDFEENRTAAVYTYQATEPDGDGYPMVCERDARGPCSPSPATVR